MALLPRGVHLAVDWPCNYFGSIARKHQHSGASRNYNLTTVCLAVTENQKNKFETSRHHNKRHFASTMPMPDDRHARRRMPTPLSRLQASPAARKPPHASAKTPGTSSTQRRRRETSAGRVARPASEDEAERGAAPVPFRVQSATGAASAAGAQNLALYSKRSCWQSFSRQKESVVLALYVAVG